LGGGHDCDPDLLPILTAVTRLTEPRRRIRTFRTSDMSQKSTSPQHGRDSTTAPNAAVAIIGQADPRAPRRLSNGLNMRRTQIEADGRQGRRRGNDAELQALDLKIASIRAVV